jgi:hypothetical protein
MGEGGLPVITVLLASTDESDAVTPHRCGIRDRLAARLHSWKEDRLLADGVDPDTTVGLSLRASALLSARMRRRFATQLRQMVRRAERPQRAYQPLVPVARRQILEQRDYLQQLVDLLSGREAVRPAGMAKVQLLLTDADSPFYDLLGSTDRLRMALLNAVNALELV